MSLYEECQNLLIELDTTKKNHEQIMNKNKEIHIKKIREKYLNNIANEIKKAVTAAQKDCTKRLEKNNLNYVPIEQIVFNDHSVHKNNSKNIFYYNSSILTTELSSLIEYIKKYDERTDRTWEWTEENAYMRWLPCYHDIMNTIFVMFFNIYGVKLGSYYSIDRETQEIKNFDNIVLNIHSLTLNKELIGSDMKWYQKFS